ncbi:hypothetical protein OF83DRAFT_1115698 [Amylostereum chailletii]|nr:hypothetical protein OF83DRAFT_1115698 [Amylostereum chailletii]
MDSHSVLSICSSLDPPTFPSTSDAFNIISSAPSRSTHSSPPAKSSSLTSDLDPEISSLYSTSFFELRKSIAERDEGFVQRMRAWESARARTGRPHHLFGTHPRRGRSHSGISAPYRSGSPDLPVDEADEDEDIVICAADTSSENGAWSPMSRSLPKKRTRSLDAMDIQDIQPSKSFIRPPLPLLSSTASSFSSSLKSVIAPPIFDNSASGEKTVAEISLAMATGAAGLTDYTAVHEVLGPAAVGINESGSEVGEMWH